MKTVAFDEGDLVDFTQRGDAEHDALDSRFAEKAHAFFAGRLFDFRSRPLLQNHLPDGVAQVQQLADRRSADIAGPAALDAADALVKRVGLFERGVEA